MNGFIAAGFWFLLGFMVASVMAYKAQERRKLQAAASFLAAKNEVIRILNSVKEMTEIKITIVDQDGELAIESEGTPTKDLH